MNLKIAGYLAGAVAGYVLGGWCCDQAIKEYQLRKAAGEIWKEAASATAESSSSQSLPPDSPSSQTEPDSSPG